MLLHLLQTDIAERVRRFIEEVPLPQPHLVIDHFSTHLQSVAIEDNTLLLAAISTFLRFRVVRLPELVPETPVPMQATIGAVGNWNHKLLVNFDMKL